MWSASLPGVAMTTWGFRWRSAPCSTMSRPPKGVEAGGDGEDEAGEATDDDDVLEADGLAQDAELLRDLEGEFPRGREDEGEDPKGVLCQPLQHRDWPVKPLAPVPWRE